MSFVDEVETAEAQSTTGMKFQQHVLSFVESLEKNSDIVTRSSCVRELRELGICDFANVLWNMPDRQFQKLSVILPEMAADDVTMQWTGSKGSELLEQSLSFVRACASMYSDITGTSLRDKRILDFGCGYGRFLRLFSYYTDHVYGVDAWDVSIEHSRKAGFGPVVKRIDPVAREIPFVMKFDFLFAFSIFTHLSEVSAIAALKALRAAANEGAVLIITIRPPEFWQACTQGQTHLTMAPDEAARYIEAHNTVGFAYYPYVDENTPLSEAHYGDTSFTLDWLLNNVPGWEFCGFDRSINDPMQRYIAFKAI